jgi:hypothetical protein
MTIGWMCCWEINFSASRNNSPASTATLEPQEKCAERSNTPKPHGKTDGRKPYLVVPSPTSSSWVFEILISTLAAGLSTTIEVKMVAPSFVTEIAPEPDADCRILSIPLGPNVLFTRSAMAMAPTKDDMRALSP